MEPGEKHVTIASKQKQIDRLKADLIKPEPLPPNSVLPRRESSGNEVLLTKGLSKGFAEPLFKNVDADQKNERVCLLGPNGCGKTLLRTISGRLEPDAGTYVIGANVRIGYYDQNVACDHPENDFRRVRRVPRLDAADPQHARAVSIPGRRGTSAWATSPAASLRASSCLLLMLLQLPAAGRADNHLDIASRGALEKALSDYGGTMLAITHDRYFISRLADRLLVMKTARSGRSRPKDAYKALLSEETDEEPSGQRAVISPPTDTSEQGRAGQRRTGLPAGRIVAEAERRPALEELLETRTQRL